MQQTATSALEWQRECDEQAEGGDRRARRPETDGSSHPKAASSCVVSLRERRVVPFCHDARSTMRLSKSQERIVAQGLLVFAVWTFLAAFSASQTVVYLLQRGQAIEWGGLLTGRFADWYTCALFTPL